MTNFLVEGPIKVGIVGTGYAASKRAEALQADQRAELKSVAGYTVISSEKFAQTYSIERINSWQTLVKQPDLDLIIICNINQDHGAIAQAALSAGKHVVLEYPLALKPLQAEALINLARQNQKLLHVEHIELIGGVHQAIRRYLPEIGEVFYGRYSTISPQQNAPRRWTYHHEMFGFPLIAALSRIHRFTDLFGAVDTVNCQTRFWDAPETGYYLACLCEAQLRFSNGLIAQITYGKGEKFWSSDRTLELYGDRGTLSFDGETGILIKGEEKIPLEVVSRQGLFAQDTQMVLDHLVHGKPLYLKPESSYYALTVAEAARQSAATGSIISIPPQL
ncbi:Gfo/Idh/MocA family protein [Gloeocapsa sp. PCC 73106]|uniref:Gfo/Idh/MocA family protein n=1 Tax=Gloeocapsa sp. PCC 73106 TaxID=102232 RepID=UPI0002AC1C46|nr:Gfo/Idh/MocA family oxidoreductase [Gloeocapsa sp. PCC 73106]ELR98617.1 putative dehydrogenase [Gloeocapsa sp. PCC 73106]